LATQASNPALALGEATRFTEMRYRLLFLLGALVVYRIGTFVPVPGLDMAAMARLFDQQEGTILGLFNMFSGGALERLSIFAMGVMPYISASIIIQMMAVVVPTMAAVKKEGEAGRRKLTQWTRYFTLVLAIFQGFGAATAFQSQGVALHPGWQFVMMGTITLASGTMFLMWLGEQITERGIGNGISMIILSGIVAGLPAAMGGTLEQVRSGEMNPAFAILLVLVKLFGIVNIESLKIPFTLIDARDLLAWIAVLTIILPTFTAMKQNDARHLLAWHGIGQGGYMLLGLVVADAMGGAGGLLHVLNHATYQAALFMSVTAVIHRTGTSDLNKLGGLVVRMPLSFLVLLVGIIGLAGLPPMNGFVSKWLIYRSLINEGYPLLFLAAVIGTLGTILSVYKLIHNMFLGQLRLEHEQVREAPWSMTVPMLLLSAVVFVTGYMPGLVFDWIAPVQAALGLPPLVYHLGGITTAGGNLDMLWLVSFMLVGFGIGALIFYSGGRARRVHQLDNYAGGHFLTAETRYQYSYNFYPALQRLIGPLYRGSFQWLESGLVSMLDLVSAGAQGIYRSVHPALYLLTVLVMVLFFWVVN